MVFRAFRLILGGALAAAALMLLAKAIGMLAGGVAGPRGLILPAGMILGIVSVAGAYYYALFRQPNVFKAFRAVLGVVIALLLFYLLASAAADVHQTVTAANFKAANLTTP